MKQEFSVRGRYLARYPNGHHTGTIGISTRVLASDQEEATQTVGQQAMSTHGYVKFNWVQVVAQPIEQGQHALPN